MRKSNNIGKNQLYTSIHALIFLRKKEKNLHLSLDRKALLCYNYKTACTGFSRVILTHKQRVLYEKAGARKMYAVIETGGKQYQVKAGDTLFIEKLNVEADSTVTFDKVVAVSTDAGLSVGTPYVAGATVSAKVLKNGKGKKITVMTYKPKKGEKKKQGHRQPYTQVQIEAINA